MAVSLKRSRNVSSFLSGVLLWIWFPLTQTAHHPWTTFPIMHCTHTFPSTITPITQLSPFTHHSDCLTTPAPHSLTHIKAAHKHSPSAKSCFALATFLSVLPCICYLCVWPRTARPSISEPVPVTSTPAWYCLRLCFASDIPVMPADHCLCDSAAVYKYILLHLDPLPLTSLYMYFLNDMMPLCCCLAASQSLHCWSWFRVSIHLSFSGNSRTHSNLRKLNSDIFI